MDLENDLILTLFGGRKSLPIKELRKKVKEECYSFDTLAPLQNAKIFNECCELHSVSIVEAKKKVNVVNAAEFGDFCLEAKFRYDVDKEMTSIFEELEIDPKIPAKKFEMIKYFYSDDGFRNYFLHRSNCLMALASPKRLQSGYDSFMKETEMSNNEFITDIDDVVSLAVHVVRLGSLKETLQSVEYFLKRRQYLKDYVMFDGALFNPANASAETYYNLAYEDNNTKSKKIFLEVAVKYNPSNKLYLVAYAEAMMSLNEIEEAEGILAKCIDLDIFWERPKESYRTVLRQLTS